MNKERPSFSQEAVGDEQKERPEVAPFETGIRSRVERLIGKSPKALALLMAGLAFAGGDNVRAFDFKGVFQNVGVEAGQQAGEEIRSRIEQKRLENELARAEKQRNEAFFKLAGYDHNALTIWLAEQEDKVSVAFGPEYGQQIQELLDEQRTLSAALADTEVAIAGLEFDIKQDNGMREALEQKLKEREGIDAQLERVESQLDNAQKRLGDVEARSLAQFRAIQETRLEKLESRMKNMTPEALEAVTAPLRYELSEADAKTQYCRQSMDYERERIERERAETAGRVGYEVTQRTIDKVLGNN